MVLYTHAQNGLAKYYIHTVVDRIRCLLAKSRLLKSLWAEVAASQIIIRNLILLSCHPDYISEEAWTDKCQRVNFLHAFGCMAFTKVSEELIRSKLDSMLVKYVLVGYCNNGYKLYN